jgi:hypothetical protein
VDVTLQQSDQPTQRGWIGGLEGESVYFGRGKTEIRPALLLSLLLLLLVEGTLLEGTLLLLLAVWGTKCHGVVRVCACKRNKKWKLGLCFVSACFL